MGMLEIKTFFHRFKNFAGAGRLSYFMHLLLHPPQYGPWNLHRGPKKVSISRAQPPPTCPSNGYARIQNGAV